MKFAAAFSLLVFCEVGIAGGSPADVPDPDRTVDQLRRITHELSDTLKKYRSHIDQEIASRDRADARLTGGQRDVLQAAVRKFIAFRIVAAREARTDTPVVRDVNELQQLILEARKYSTDARAVLRAAAVVPLNKLDRQEEAAFKVRHDQLIKARDSAQRVAKEAWISLPIGLPENRSAAELVERAWDLNLNGARSGQTPNSAPCDSSSFDAAILPLCIPAGQRVTLLKSDSYRVALTDSGRIDGNGRRIFFQEEWVQRRRSVIRRRWRVGLDLESGEHVLLYGFPPVEVQGKLADLYSDARRNPIWSLEPPEGSSPPPLARVEAAIQEVADGRESVSHAVDRFSGTVESAIMRNDQRCAASICAPVDAGLAPSLRNALFAVRAHLAHVPEILAGEAAVHRAIEAADESVRALEPLAAWANIISADSIDVLKWEDLEQRAEKEIDLLHRAEAKAVASLPPDTSLAEARFPTFERDSIVRIRRMPWHPANDDRVRFIEEIWRPVKPMRDLCHVQRTAVLVLVDPQTGEQFVTAAKAKHYPMHAGILLDEIFDENAADELLTWQTAGLPNPAPPVNQ